jgi:chromosome segregation ATPase
MKILLTVALLLGTSLMLLFLYLGEAQAASKTENDLEARVAALEDTIDQFYEEFSVHEEHILALEDRVAQLEEDPQTLRQQRHRGRRSKLLG